MRVYTFNHLVIEKKWQEEWEKRKIFSPSLARSKKAFYNLMMFPYPSAEGLHVGNMYAFTGSDVYGRYKRMSGLDVFEPIGLDGFGIHSENYALKIGQHPKDQAVVSEKNFYRQLHAIGNAYDWTKTLETYKEDYYRWTQWLFIKMFKAGLAYRKSSKVNWCPIDKTVIADEQVIDGHCERDGALVEKKDLEQWFFRITDYADRLLEGLSKIDWSRKVKVAQRNWIGRSEGAGVKFKILNPQPKINPSLAEKFQIEVFTTRLDTIQGATFLVLSPQRAEDLLELIPKSHKERVSKYIKERLSRIAVEESTRDKTGVDTGLLALNPVAKKKIPVWVSSYVLSDVGTGAIMAVPADDERDRDFAQQHGLPTTDSGTPKAEMGRLFKEGIAEKKTAYHLRDWLISRQRYWGPPIPMIYCEECAAAGKGERGDMSGWYVTPERDLPVKLPYIKDYRPLGKGVSPLAAHKEFYEVSCPSCGAKARRETDVSDTFLDSSWYFLAYPNLETREWKSRPSTGSKRAFFSKEIMNSWLPVDMYIGGAEHSVLHLLYARFVTMTLYDMGFLEFEEPFSRFYAHGLLISEGAKMSKSQGNVVVPDQYIEKYGADTLRMYLLFLGPFHQGGDFRDAGIEGMRKFLDRVWRLYDNPPSPRLRRGSHNDIMVKMHRTIKKVTEDIENFRFNTAIAAIMEYVNSLRTVHSTPSTVHLTVLLKLLAPFAPHMTEELWQKLVKGKRQEVKGKFNSVHLSGWPEYDESLTRSDVVTIPVQVNGKVRAQISVGASHLSDKKRVVNMARKDKNIAKYIKGKRIKSEIYVEGKIVNFVVVGA